MARALPATQRRGPRLRVGRRTHQVLLFLHVVASLGWMGAGAANVVLAGVALSTGAPELRGSCYQLMDAVDFALVIPLAFAALLTGLVVSVTTTWGLLRYRWVLVKLVLTLAVLVWSTFAVGVWVEQGMQAAGAPSPTAGRLVGGAGANLVAFLFMTWISISKPWGPIRRRNR